ncbi:MAG: FAD:protein FMN transferase [Paludibacteraceae bacterium]|nr:FAD:protein FMN transferase [Paludibacteraceae bacterium]
MTRKQVIISTGLIALVAVVLLVIPDEPKATYHTNKGQVFGTYYAIQYESVIDLQDSITATFAAFDRSMSLFNPASTLSRINGGTDSVADACFVQMYRTAEEVHRLSGGAFDITVAPLVNLWGFGLKNRARVTQEQVDDLLPHVGQEKIGLRGTVVEKTDPMVQVDAGAIAKGQSCDIVAALLQRNGCANYLVDIGGEVVAKGHNPQDQPWRIGITRPIDDASGSVNEVQAVLQTTDIALATSGNYRNFYYDGEQKRSHTIDPRTGYPVQHSLLSATVRSNNCMRADALATACMVLGEEAALAMIEADTVSACYLIVAVSPAEGDTAATRTVQSSRW